MEEQQIFLQPEMAIIGGGAVSSVNGYTGNVVLTTSDLENTSDYQTGSEVEAAISIEVAAREGADNNLQTQIDAISASSDVTDIVGTYAELQNYDTSTLGNNDIIKVLQDESQNGEATYYRWSTTTQSFTLIGEEGPYYTKAQADVLLNAKQDTLTAGTNIQISNNTISATDTTYSNFTGTDGTAAGTAGLVPAPATTDAGKFLKADGTWDSAGGAVNVVQATGTSTTDVMSQKAMTDVLFNNNQTQKVQIGAGAESSATGNYSSIAIGGSKASGINTIAIGLTASALGGETISLGRDSSVTIPANNSVAIGRLSSVTGENAVAIGTRATATQKGQFDISTGTATWGYNNSSYRLLTGLYDGQSAHDAVTKGQLDAIAIRNAGAPTTATVGTVGQLLEDTTNGKLYQCTAIDTTDPQNPSYTWTEVGGGGTTVVQTIGTSTTDVMSQKATTDMIFDNNLTYRIKVGSGIVTSNIGNSTYIAIGDNSKVNGSDGVAIGSRAETNFKGIAIGSTNLPGTETKASGENSIAIGTNARALGRGSIAFGNLSSASSQGEMNIGTSSTYLGYKSSNYRLLSGLYDGQSAHDAATYGQLNTRLDGLTLLKISQTDYDNLSSYDSNTLYIITGA